MSGAFLLVLGFHGLFPNRVYASSGDFVINEIYPNQISDGIDTEWAELYRPDNLDPDLVDYELVKITASGTEYKKQLSASICSGDSGYYVCNLGAGWLANSGATLVLRKNNIEIDRVVFGTLDINAPVPGQGQSISRIPNGQDTGNNADDFQIIPTSKGGENILPPPITYSDYIFINEILPQPATGVADEFIEIFNSSEFDIDLKDWQLDAGTFAISTIIKAKEYRVFKNPEIKIGLTDTGDTTNLIDPNGEIKSAVLYGKSIRGCSYSKFGSEWQWTTTQTPENENILTIDLFVAEEDVPITMSDIKTARQKEDGETVLVEGIVSVEPGKLSSQYFYIQDGLSGIQVYDYDKNFPELKVGDLISVTGELATISNERRIKIIGMSDIIVIRQNSPPSPKLRNIDQLGEEYEGQFVEITGVVSKTSGSTFYVHGSGEIQIIIREQTGIVKPKMRRGDSVRVSGIFSQYQDHYRLLPFLIDGVKILTSGRLPESGFDGLNNNAYLQKLWKLRQSQPMKRKRLVTNLAKP